MQVKLKVIGGRNDCREIRITVPEFIIGRGDEAHLKPSSDLISRKHCSIRLENGSVQVADMGSRNGTYINGARLEGPSQVRSGDRLRVGRLQFEIIIDHAEPGHKKPKVGGVADAAARTASADREAFDEDSITDWLTQAGSEESERVHHETAQFSLDETPTRLFLRSEDLEKQGEKPTDPDDVTESDTKNRKKKYKKLPPRDTVQAESSRGAADDVLRKFFNRR
jgi:predicted component of type VI protein secretion system